MCGIVGFINCGNANELKNALLAVQHRGPDFKDIKWFDKNQSGLGHARLSIIDLSSDGQQPMYDNLTGNWIVYNGEIYNYKSIREELKSQGISFNSSSDTEVLLKAYGVWGKKVLKKLNGMFSFAIYNEKSNNVFICRDRLGIKPLYYYQKNNQFIFASEIKSILAYSGYKKEVDLFAIQTPVHFQASPRTGFKNIFKLDAGYSINFINGKLIKEKYWDIYPTESDLTFNEAFEELDYLLNDSVKLQMISDAPIGALLSGGLDSSIISVLMQKNMTKKLNTFTIKFEKEDLKRQGNVDDSYYANKIANDFGFQHNEIIIKPNVVELLPKMVWHMDEPIADPSSINTYLISKEAANMGIKVLLSGMGADEFFSGYRSHLACLKSDTYQKIPKQLRDKLEFLVKKIPESNSSRNFKYIRWIKSFLNVASKSKLDRALTIKNSALTEDNYNDYFIDAGNYRNSLFVERETKLFNHYPNLSYLTKLCYCDTKTYLTDHNFAYSDKSMMAASIEGRPPLIDHRIVELMFKLQPKYKINNGVQKYLLKKVSEKYLPREIIYRKKAPFSAPMRGWLKKELKEMVMDLLSYETIKQRNIYNPEYVQNLIVNNEKGLQDNSQLIWRLMVNEIWFRTFFK